MATTKKGLTARIAAGLGAAALATLTALGGALPASATGTGNIDPDAPASIVIHKHTQTTPPGEVGSGDELDPGPSGAPIDGVEFAIQQVTNIDVSDSETWTSLSSLTADDVVGSADYVLGEDEGVDAWTVTTAGGGIAEQDVPLGVYLVTELSTPADANVVIRSKPFLVVVPQPRTDGTWNYDVHVYPKNAVSSITKSAAAFDQQGFGSTVAWTITTPAPIRVQGTEIESYAIEDTLDPRLTLAASGAATVTVAGVEITDFAVSGGPSGLVTLTFGADGIAALEANPGAPVVATVTTVVGANGELGDGSIENTAVVRINGVAVTSAPAVDHWGSVEFMKVDDEGNALQGAIFEVRDSSGDVVAVGGAETFTSDEHGLVTISGLRTTAAGDAEYTVIELQAPAGYMLPTTATWTVEVPVGATAEVEMAPVVNAQVPPYSLPVTGGAGQTAFMLGGFGLVALALGFALLRRRSAQPQD
ncbi:SpaH/EbpB family LPXTG-anchored major pilin [Agrococcus terreus]|uniref:LPXTG-motif cell wall anchor domain-containing protein/fimbrial isopeptide formation D2 domain-containing protein n=1 Tax=Agrococcus terreus TaxID=574649 RepID=A0ABQ2KPY1_9MICO|nr:SpaH/EbpB family LPXTG-anchored major pilin [Agrococcus terreus]GGN89119.1 hypothetical protein GCM10010968_25450 [Agrococcus terreus]